VTRRDFLRLAAGGAAASLLAGCGALGLAARAGTLRVWSCGGNYDLLLDFNEWFQHETGCRITYTSAPVERLVSLVSAHPRKVDLLVGRSGPGWEELQGKGRLAEPPKVFALDTYVIIVAPSNPAGIRGLSDLKRPGVRTAYSPRASGPSSTAVQAVLEAADRVIEPGIWEGYVRNAVASYDCGWKVFDAVIEGLADATVARLSMTTVSETRGKVEAIPIPVKVMAAMRTAHGAIPQRVTVLADAPEPELAASYLQSLLGDPGRRFCEQHGYIHRLSHNADDYRPLFEMSAGRGGERKGRAARGSGEDEVQPDGRGTGRGLGRRGPSGGSGSPDHSAGGPSRAESRGGGRGAAAGARGRRSEE
jgi:molybdate transport system substrate-binding protein